MFTMKKKQDIHVALHGITPLITSVITWKTTSLLHEYNIIHYMVNYMKHYKYNNMLLLSSYIIYYMFITCYTTHSLHQILHANMHEITSHCMFPSLITCYLHCGLHELLHNELHDTLHPITCLIT